MRTIAVPANSAQPIVTADGKTVYLTNSIGNVYAVDTETGDITTIPIDGPTGSWHTQQRRNAALRHQPDLSTGTGRIKVINTANNQVIDGETIETGRFVPTTVTASPDGRHLYATGIDYRTDNSGLSSSSIAVIDTDDQSVDFANVGGLPSAISVSPDGQKVYVSVSRTTDPTHRCGKAKSSCSTAQTTTNSNA